MTKENELRLLDIRNKIAILRTENSRAVKMDFADCDFILSLLSPAIMTSFIYPGAGNE